jgi:hypothetical protein
MSRPRIPAGGAAIERGLRLTSRGLEGSGDDDARVGCAEPDHRPAARAEHVRWPNEGQTRFVEAVGHPARIDQQHRFTVPRAPGGQSAPRRS